MDEGNADRLMLLWTFLQQLLTYKYNVISAPVHSKTTLGNGQEFLYDISVELRCHVLCKDLPSDIQKKKPSVVSAVRSLSLSLTNIRQNCVEAVLRDFIGNPAPLKGDSEMIQQVFAIAFEHICRKLVRSRRFVTFQVLDRVSHHPAQWEHCPFQEQETAGEAHSRHQGPLDWSF